MDWLTTTTILHDLRDYSNRGAWDRLVERFRPPIASFVRQVGVAPADCEDVAQNTLLAFAEAYRGGKYDRASGRLSRWLFGIAYKQALRQRRRDAHDPPAPALPEGAEPKGSMDEAAVVDVWDRLWSRHLLEKGIERARAEFDASAFRVFELVVLEDRSPADAAKALELPVEAVYGTKHRVLRRVRELIAELGELQDEKPGPIRESKA
ncbi:MAG: RNA polymerase sigma factor [Candidatus Eiseniibacteriota bacterium]